jgi:hypothetical protein
MCMQVQTGEDAEFLCRVIGESLSIIRDSVGRLALLLEEDGQRGDDIATVAFQAENYLSSQGSLDEAIAPAENELGEGVAYSLRSEAIEQALIYSNVGAGLTRAHAVAYAKHYGKAESEVKEMHKYVLYTALTRSLPSTSVGRSVLSSERGSLV